MDEEEKLAEFNKHLASDFEILFGAWMRANPVYSSKGEQFALHMKGICLKWYFEGAKSAVLNFPPAKES